MRGSQLLIQSQIVRLSNRRSHITDASADIDDDVPIVKKIQAPSYAKKMAPFAFEGLSKTKPSGSSSRIDAIDVDDE